MERYTPGILLNRTESIEEESPVVDHKPSELGDTHDRVDATAELDNKENNKTDSASRPHWLQLSVAALAVDLPLFLFAVLWITGKHD